MILALDPSSTRTGYALMSSATPAGLIDAGLIKPTRSRDTAYERVYAMQAQLDELLCTLTSNDQVVIEVPSGKVHRGRHGGGGAGLATYGLAAGAIVTACWRSSVGYAGVQLVSDVAWTRGTPKGRRAEVLARQFPQVQSILGSGKDPGHDSIDAIGIAAWYFETLAARRAA